MPLRRADGTFLQRDAHMSRRLGFLPLPLRQSSRLKFLAPTQSHDLIGMPELCQTVERRAYRVERVPSAQRFGNDVVRSHQLHVTARTLRRR